MKGANVRQEHGKIDGNVAVSDTLTLFGMCTGNVVVENGGVLVLHGMCSGNVKVEAGGEAQIRGMVSGNVVNNGGLVEIWGMVTGNVDEHDGTTIRHEGAIINRKVI
jgi:cytoskeletal protein CcmA (bactofilin family)